MKNTRFQDTVAAKLNLTADEYRRYELFTKYLVVSPTFIKAQHSMHRYGQPYSKYGGDLSQVLTVADDFDDLQMKSWEDWWLKKGQILFGRGVDKDKLVLIDTMQAGFKAAQTTKANQAIFAIPTSLTITEAVKQLKKHAHLFATSQEPKQFQKAKYKLLKTKMPTKYLEKGLEALALYQQGLTNWQIGNKLKLVLTFCFDENSDEAKRRGTYVQEKNALGAAARRLITDAAYVAENAARGRFPSSKSFSEADISPYRRR